jgi:uncharacterized protein
LLITTIVPVHPSLRTTSPLTSFRSARITFSFAWTEQYDQGGIYLAFRRSGSSSDTSIPAEKWIKTGVEFYNGVPMIGTVACDTWADWSLAPLPPSTAQGSSDGKRWITVHLQREGDKNGTSVWVYLVGEDGTQSPLREVCWVFGGGDEDIASWELEVAGFAARPETSVKDGLDVHFKGFEVKWDWQGE